MKPSSPPRVQRTYAQLPDIERWSVEGISAPPPAQLPSSTGIVTDLLECWGCAVAHQQLQHGSTLTRCLPSLTPPPMHVTGAPAACPHETVEPWCYNRVGLVAVVAMCLLGAWALAVHCAASSLTHTAEMRRHLLDVPKLIETQVSDTQSVWGITTHVR